MSVVRHALRVLRHNPLFSSTIVLTLALGIGATTATFSVWGANSWIIRNLGR